MRVQAIVLPLIAGTALIAIFLLGLDEAGANLLAPDEPATEADSEESELNPTGAAYEINIGPEGHLWISDFGANEIWQVNPVSGAYNVYQGIFAPSDARLADTGYVWWGGGADNRFGRLDPDTGEASLWTLPHEGVTLFGTQIDANGDFWVIAAF